MSPRTPRHRTVLPALVLSTSLALTGVIRADAAPDATTTPVSTSTRAPTAHRAASDNPLAGRPWGVYRGPGDQAWKPYVNAVGPVRAILGKIALRPKAKWFGDWVGNSEIDDEVRSYVRSSQSGNPEALVQLSLFRMVPWEGEACDRLPTLAERASYRTWIRGAARGIGDAHAAVILQPDGPFALCVPGGSPVPARLIRYAARTLSALPHTSVYIDGGAGDWPAEGSQGGVEAAVRFLVADGIRFARGVALNSTHYSATGIEVVRGAAIVRALAKRGITGKHVVVNTSSNGHPFEFGDYRGPDPDNARVCRAAQDRGLCVSLGIPPTTDVDNPDWHLPADVNRLARQYVDGYLWIGRPWLYRQADPFVTARAIKLVRSSPYRG